MDNQIFYSRFYLDREGGALMIFGRFFFSIALLSSAFWSIYWEISSKKTLSYEILFFISIGILLGLLFWPVLPYEIIITKKEIVLRDRHVGPFYWFKETILFENIKHFEIQKNILKIILHDEDFTYFFLLENIRPGNRNQLIFSLYKTGVKVINKNDAHVK